MDRKQIIKEIASAMCYHGINGICNIDKNPCDCDCMWKEPAEALYNAGYRKTFTSDLASDTQKAFKEGYEKGYDDGFEDGCNQGGKDNYDRGFSDGQNISSKETATEILQEFKNTFIAFNKKDAIPIDLFTTRLENICKKYGVEVEEWHIRKNNITIF